MYVHLMLGFVIRLAAACLLFLCAFFPVSASTAAEPTDAESFYERRSPTGLRDDQIKPLPTTIGPSSGNRATLTTWTVAAGPT